MSENAENQPQFAINRVYVKDFSFESPRSPFVFKEQWKPEVNLDLHTDAQKIEDNVHEVVISLTVTAKQEEKTVFIVEIKQAGLFTLQHFPEDTMKHALGSMCPTILYPFAREAISSMVTHAGFPQLLLAPINFEALYQQHLQKESGKSA